MSKPEDRRTKAAIDCSKKLGAAAKSLRLFLAACEECRDGSGSTTLAGKGRDGREIMIADLEEYASHLDRMYPGKGQQQGEKA